MRGPSDEGVRGKSRHRSTSPNEFAPTGADPADKLSPTAKRLLVAARRVLARDGFSGLTLEAITAEAGENKAAVRYHFGNKDGLITALVEWLDHDDSVRLLAQLSEETDAEARLDLLLRVQREGCRYQEANLLFFDLLPHVLRDPSLRERLSRLYQWYRELDERVLAPEADAAVRDEVERLAALAIAVNDGLTIQCAADPGFDADSVFGTWERLFRRALRELGEGS